LKELTKKTRKHIRKTSIKILKRGYVQRANFRNKLEAMKKDNFSNKSMT